MKKGCFVASIVVFTLLVGAAVYLIRYKKDYFKEFAKEKIINIALNEFHDKMEKVKPSEYKDSLRVRLDAFVDKTKNLPFDQAMKQVQDVLNETKFFIQNKQIDSIDYSQFKQILERYERPKKD